MIDYNSLEGTVRDIFGRKRIVSRQPTPYSTWRSGNIIYKGSLHLQLYLHFTSLWCTRIPFSSTPFFEILTLFALNYFMSNFEQHLLLSPHFFPSL